MNTNPGGTVTQLLFIDPAVEGYQALLADVSPATRVILLDPAQDGLRQIASVLEGYSNLDGIHILSHGSAGSLQLGKIGLSSSNLGDYHDALQTIGASLGEHGDILLYGCDVAAGTTGKDFIRRLADLTGADVAASDDFTGSAALGGDWQLEARTGTIEVTGLSSATFIGTLVTRSPDFQTLQPNAFGLADVGRYASPTFADIDGDGDLDAFIGEKDGNTHFFENTGSASVAAFTAAGSNPFGFVDVGSYAKPTFADIDGDGDLDAFIGEGYGNTLFFENTGSNSAAAFDAAIGNPFGLTDVGYLATPTFADIDGDGDLDAFIGDYDGNTQFFRNTGSASAAAFAPASVNPFGLADVGRYAAPTFADIDGDGDLDALIGNWEGNTQFFKNTGSAGAAAFAAATVNPFGLDDLGFLAAPAFADIDADGDLDAFIGNHLGYTYFYENYRPTVVLGSSTLQVSEGGAGSSYTLALSEAPNAAVTLSLDVTNGQVRVDQSTLTFTVANWNTPQTVTVTAVDDAVGEGTHQGVIRHTASSADAGYDGLAIDTLPVRILDDDLPAGVAGFQPQQTNPFGLADVGRYASPTLADIDADGDLDAFVGEFDGTTLFFENTGSNSAAAFAAASTNPFGLADVGRYAAPTLADIDADGDLDAFVSNNFGTMRFFENTGSASVAAFAAALFNPFGLANIGFYATPTFADIDADGDLDAFVGNQDGNTVFFENVGSASAAAFAAASTNPFGLADVGSAASPTFADLDADGDLDAFVGNRDGNTLFFENTGSASGAAFAAASTNPFGLADVDRYAAPTLADLDGDGDLDAFMGNSTGNMVFFENRPPAVILGSSSLQLSEGAAGSSYTLVLKEAPSDPVTITLDTTNGQVSVDKPTVTFTTANWDTPQTVTVSAVDDTVGEGTHLGVIRHTASSAYAGYNGITIDKLVVKVIDDDLPAGTPDFLPPQTNPFSLTDVGVSSVPTFADIDGDGDLDAFIGESYGNTLFFENTGSNSAAAFDAAIGNPFGLTDVGYLATPTFADIDGDGDLDAFIGAKDGNTRFFENTGSASTAAFAPASVNPFGLADVGWYAAPTFADIDGDGDLDAFVGNNPGNTVFFENTGSASAAAFTTALGNPFGLSGAGLLFPTFADIDGDGDLDVFIGDDSGNTVFVENTGAATAAAFDTSSVSSNPFGLSDVGTYAAPTLVDIDADGDLDALVGSNAGITQFFENRPPTVILGTSTLQLSEGSAGSSYSLALSDAPSADVTLSLDTTNGQVSVDKPTLTFTVANWNTPQTVAVSAVDDTVGEGTHRGVIRHTSGSADARYDGIAIDTLVVEVIDDDLPDGVAVFQSPQTNPFGLTDVGWSASPTFADIDADGDLDAFVGNSVGNTLFFENTGSNSSAAFAAASNNPFGLADVGVYASPTLADIDADGDLDAFVGNNPGNTVFFENTGSASAAAFAAAISNPYGLALANVGFSASPTFADIDGDGDLDAFVGEYNGNTLFFENTGSASAAAFAAASSNPFGLADVVGSASPTFADIDGDGDLDAFVGEYNGNTLFFENTGSASGAAFAAARTNPFGLADVGTAASPTLADIDADGDLDVFIGNGDGGIIFLENRQDDEAPAKPIVAGISSDTGTAGDGITRDRTLVINGTAEAASVVTVRLGGSVIGTTTTNGSGGWSYDHTGTSLANGTYAVTATARDAAGNVSVASDAYAVKVDGTANYYYGTAKGNTLRGTTLADTMFGRGGADKLYGQGGNDRLGGGAGNDRLDGGAGADTMLGGSGNDIYIVNTANDAVVEKAKKGFDTVRSSVTHTLRSNVEKLVLTGSGNLKGIGNGGANTLLGNKGNNVLKGNTGNDEIKGNAGNDVLIGGGGADVISGGGGSDVVEGAKGADRLTGGFGKDRFRYVEPAHGRDTVTDFKRTQGDKVYVKGKNFKVLAKGALKAGRFAVNDKGIAKDIDDYFVFNTTTHTLYFDANGTGAGGRIKLATFTNGVTLKNTDIVVY